MKVRLDELVEEIRKLESENPEGFTAREMAERFGHTPDWAREKLRSLSGKIKVVCTGRRRVTRMDGQPGQVPVYRLVKEKK